jgi:hypothetical protein
MTERKLQLLQEQSYCTLPNTRQTREDLREIYGPRYSRLASKALGIFVARPIHEDARPPFRVRALPQSFEHMGISMGDISLPGRAAGWAALQLYRNKRNIFLESMLAIDEGLAGGMAAFAWLTSHPTPSRTTPIEMWLHGTFPNAQTGVRVRNESGDRTLNHMLESLHAEYRVLERGVDHDAMLGGVMGARSLSEFHGAWDRAWAQDTPAASARHLLESGIFIAEP